MQGLVNREENFEEGSQSDISEHSGIARCCGVRDSWTWWCFYEEGSEHSGRK